MPLTIGAMTCGFSAADMADRQRTGQQILGKLELANECEFALAKPGGLRAFGLRFYLEVILLQEMKQRNTIYERENSCHLRWITAGPLRCAFSAACSILHY